VCEVEISAFSVDCKADCPAWEKAEWRSTNVNKTLMRWLEAEPGLGRQRAACRCKTTFIRKNPGKQVRG
jgi:hypothetical protein